MPNSRMESTLARMTRAARGMMGIEMARMTLGIEGPRAADITRASTRSGSPCRMSMMRWTTRSVLPPTYPERRPMTPPRSEATAVEPRPTRSDTRAP